MNMKKAQAPLIHKLKVTEKKQTLTKRTALSSAKATSPMSSKIRRKFITKVN